MEKNSIQAEDEPQNKNNDHFIVFISIIHEIFFVCL